jgi:hypothetical protein
VELDVVEEAYDTGFVEVDERDVRIAWAAAAAEAGPDASAPRVNEEGFVRIALPAPPRPVDM